MKNNHKLWSITKEKEREILSKYLFRLFINVPKKCSKCNIGNIT